MAVWSPFAQPLVPTLQPSYPHSFSLENHPFARNSRRCRTGGRRSWRRRSSPGRGLRTGLVPRVGRRSAGWTRARRPRKTDAGCRSGTADRGSSQQTSRSRCPWARTTTGSRRTRCVQWRTTPALYGNRPTLRKVKQAGMNKITMTDRRTMGGENTKTE